MLSTRVPYARRGDLQLSILQKYGVPYLLKPVDPPVNDGVRSLAIIHVAIVQGSTGEPWRGPDGCGIHVGDGNTAPDPVSKSEKARLWAGAAARQGWGARRF